MLGLRDLHERVVKTVVGRKDYKCTSNTKQLYDTTI